MLKKEAIEVLNLIDKISSGKTPADEMKDAVEDVKNVGNIIRNAWSLLHKDIKGGVYSWDELQDIGVDAYSREEVEGFIERAKVNDRGTGGQIDNYGVNAEKGNGTNRHASDDTPLKRNSTRSSSETVLTETVSKMMEAINSFNETFASIAAASVQPHEEIKGLLEEVVCLQKETVQGQKDILASQRQAAEEQREIMNDMINRMAKQNDAAKETNNTQLAPLEKPQDAESSLMESQTPNLADMVSTLRKSMPEVEASSLEIESPYMTAMVNKLRKSVQGPETSPLEIESPYMTAMVNNLKKSVQEAEASTPEVKNNHVGSTIGRNTAERALKKSFIPQSEPRSTSTKRKRRSETSGLLFGPPSSKKLNSSRKRPSFDSVESAVSRKLMFSE